MELVLHRPQSRLVRLLLKTSTKLQRFPPLRHLFDSSPTRYVYLTSSNVKVGEGRGIFQQMCGSCHALFAHLVYLTHASCATPLSFNIPLTHQRSHSRLAFVGMSNLDSLTDVFFFSAFLPLSSPLQILHPPDGLLPLLILF